MLVSKRARSYPDILQNGTRIIMQTQVGRRRAHKTLILHGMDSSNIIGNYRISARVKSGRSCRFSNALETRKEDCFAPAIRTPLACIGSLIPVATQENGPWLCQGEGTRRYAGSRRREADFSDDFLGLSSLTIRKRPPGFNRTDPCCCARRRMGYQGPFRRGRTNTSGVPLPKWKAPDNSNVESIVRVKAEYSNWISDPER